MRAQSPAGRSPALVIDDVPGLSAALGALVAEEARAALRARGRFAIAVPGGSVATTLFPGLARTPLDWPLVDVFWTDERAVAPDHPDSNYGVARRLWLDHVAVAPARVHRMKGEAADLAAAAAEYEAEMAGALAPFAGLDLALLGVGPDGHVASLFPGHAVLDERVHLARAVTDAPKPPPCRLTLTLPAIASAGSLVVVALGGAKADVLHAGLDDPACPLPVALALRSARRAWVFADGAAARLLAAR